MPNWALPQSAAKALDPGQRKSGNPGLVLDRLLEYPTKDLDTYAQEQQKEHLEIVCEAITSNAACLNSILDSGWDALVEACDGAEQFRMRTVWRLAMHLSRATAVENASVCLHPVYGFPYLPGTGLKGLARAWAELQGLNDSDEFKRIFGTQGGTGSVLFLEAWPASISGSPDRPTIEVDIVNNHHPEYYRKRGANAPPGDWESPVPVYFLAVAPNVEFRFAVAKARFDTCDDDVVQAVEWLKGGLTELGFGAKTAAGYGYFAELGETAQDRGHAAIGEGSALDSFRSKHKSLLRSPTKSDVGNAVAELEKMEPGELRKSAAQWVYECLESSGMLSEKTKRNPVPYGERLRKLMEEGD